MKRIEKFRDVVISGMIIINFAALFVGCLLAVFQTKPAKQTQEYVTRDEVHAIVDSILTEIYD